MQDTQMTLIMMMMMYCNLAVFCVFPLYSGCVTSVSFYMLLKKCVAFFFGGVGGGGGLFLGAGWGWGVVFSVSSMFLLVSVCCDTAKAKDAISV